MLLSELAALDDHLKAGLSPHEVGLRMLRRAMAVLGAACGMARVAQAADPSLEIIEVGQQSRLPSAALEAFQCGKEAWLSTTHQLNQTLVAQTRLGALAMVGIDVAGKRVGALLLWFNKEREFTSSERFFLRTLGRILAQGVYAASQRARQDAAEEHREKMVLRAQALSDAFRLVVSSTSMTRIYDELARVACETPADFSAIRVLSEDGQLLKFAGVHHRDATQGTLLREALLKRMMPATLGDTARVLKEGIGLLVPKVDMPRLLQMYEGTPFGEYIAQFPVSTIIVVPLRSRGSTFGVASVGRAGGAPFNEGDLRFMEEVADRAGAALDSATLVEKLSRSEEQLRVALEAGRLGAWEWDISAQRVTWSTTLENIHGLQAGTFAGTFEAYQNDIHPEDRQHVLAGVASAVEQRTDHHVVYRIIRPDGEVRWLDAHGKLLCDDTGAPQRMVGVCLDITQRRRSEEKLRDTLLALRVADQRKDDFLAMLAHELRNPLGPMLNATYLLDEHGLGKESASRALKILNRQVNHMARLLDDLLDVSRVTRGKVTLSREPLDISELVREVVSDHRESFQAVGLQISLNLIAPIYVFADRVRMEQVMGNLLSNALKFSSPGQTVRVVANRDALTQKAVITITDEGMGFEPGLLEQMFDPFVQGDTSLSRPSGGLGLGLAVVRGLLALHDGSVVASSPGPGKGAALKVELPLHTTSLSASKVPQSGAPATKPFVATILVFEDNGDAAESLRAILTDAGYNVWLESTGAQAIDVVMRVQPDLVLCDLGLPDRDGYAVARDIRAHHALSYLPLVAISGYGAADDLSRSKEAGFNRHLTKPVAPQLLLQELSSCLAQPH